MAGPSGSAEIAAAGLMLVLSSPSGAGKSTIARNVLEGGSRPFAFGQRHHPRAAAREIEGVHYHFVSKKEFERLRDSDALLEWAEVHGNFYGTPREPVEVAMAEGRDMLFDIDWQGALATEGQDAGRHRLDLILPPTMTGAEIAPERRAEDQEADCDPAEERPRGNRALGRYDFVVVNDDLDRASPRFARLSRPSGCAATAGRAFSISFPGCSTSKWSSRAPTPRLEEVFRWQRATRQR